MAKYQTLPSVIEAEKASDLLDKAANAWAELPDWVKSSYEKGNLIFADGKIHVNGIHGWNIALKKDYVIKGTDNGICVMCRAEEFAKTFQPVQ